MSEINLFGRLFIRAEIESITGLHIGGAGTDLEIGGLDKAVVRNPFNNRPYIPGSSLRGKMRSQTEKVKGLPQNNRIAQVRIHTCKDPDNYGKCAVCQVFGVPAELDFSGPTRLLVRDIELSDKSVDVLINAKTDLLYAELKTEVAIDRVTSAATPRTIERVPAGAVFSPAELVYSIYNESDYRLFKVVLDAMQLVEDDYLGGGGSRGSGKVSFRNLEVFARAHSNYSEIIPFKQFKTLQEFSADFVNLETWLRQQIPVR